MRLWLLLLPLLVTGSLQGQWRQPYPGARLRPGRPERPAPGFNAPTPGSSGRLIVGGLLGAAAGLGGGLLAYSALDRQEPCFASDCDSDLGAGLVAATVGMTLGTPLGAHLANGRRGSYIKGLLLSAAAGAAVWGGAALADDARWLLLLPPAQITAAVVAERSSTR